jgi:hypothetical protein
VIIDEYFFMTFIQVDLRHSCSPPLTGFLLYRLPIFVKKSMRKIRLIFLEESDRHCIGILLLKVYQIVLKVV